MEDKSKLLQKLQSYNFAAYDMLLYLDTHPDDKSAFEIFKDLVCNVKKIKADYEKIYGPLTPYSAAAAVSIVSRLTPCMAMTFRFGACAMTDRGTTARRMTMAVSRSGWSKLSTISKWRASLAYADGAMCSLR